MSRFQEYLEGGRKNWPTKKSFGFKNKFEDPERTKWTRADRTAKKYDGKEKPYDSSEDEAKLVQLLSHIEGIKGISYNAEIGEAQIEADESKLSVIKKALKGTEFSLIILDFV